MTLRLYSQQGGPNTFKPRGTNSEWAKASKAAEKLAWVFGVIGSSDGDASVYSNKYVLWSAFYYQIRSLVFQPVPCFCAMFSSKKPKNPDLHNINIFDFQLLTKYTTIFITLRSGVQFPPSLQKQKSQ